MKMGHISSKAIFLNQTWVRYNGSNSGTTVLGDPASSSFDIGLGRTRMQMFGQITDRAFLYFQFGRNNYNHIAQYDNDQTDHFPRKLSVNARGKLGKFDYIIVLSDPFPLTSN